MIVEQIIENKAKSKDNKHSEKTIRSAVKSISWRTIGTIDTIAISWLITGKVNTALSIGAIELITKMVLYFAHERAWNNIKWGKK